MTTDFGSLLMSLAVLLAGYSFLFTMIGWKLEPAREYLSGVERIEPSDLFTSTDRALFVRTRGRLRQAAKPTIVLTMVAIVVTAVFFPPVVHVVKSMEPGMPYSPERAGFVMAWLFWVSVVGVMGTRLYKLWSWNRTVRTIERVMPM